MSLKGIMCAATTGSSRLCASVCLASAVIACATLTSCGGSGSREGQRAANSSSPNSQPSPIGQAVDCNSPFYPVNSTSSWQYNATFGDRQLTLAIKRTGVQFGTFTDHLEFSDGTSLDVPWSCIEQGLLCSEFLPLDLGHFPGVLKLKYTNGSGVTLPPVNGWNVGYHWTGRFAVTGQRTDSSGTQEANGTVDMDNDIVGSGKLTVPAGTFDAFQIDSTMMETLTVGTGSATGNTLRISVKTSAWYARDVGLIKIAFSGDPGTGVEVLSSYSK
ncbi:MAG TPA: hypothetical protein VEZ90_14405 [Blastocatellia bacterium]|nr:hypothetical protein [Blastocatellia bacterium]